MSISESIAILAMFFAVISILIAIAIFFYSSHRTLTKNTQLSNKMSEEISRIIKINQGLNDSTDNVLLELNKMNMVGKIPAVDFISVLMHQWDFFAKLIRNRAQKAAIATFISQNMIKDKDIIALDSGSTTDLIPRYLIYKDVSIYTNNTFAVVNVSGITGMKIFQLPGYLDSNYAATYSIQAEDIISNTPIDTVIIATRSLSIKDGLRVSKNDEKNKSFKRVLLNHQFAKNFIIAVDSTKFRPEKEDETGVLNQQEWQAFLQKNKDKLVIVTNKPNDDSDYKVKSWFADEKSAFENVGIEVKALDF